MIENIVPPHEEIYLGEDSEPVIIVKAQTCIMAARKLRRHEAILLAEASQYFTGHGTAR